VPTEIIPGLIVGGRPHQYAGKGYDLVVCAEGHVRPELLVGYDGVFVAMPMRDARPPTFWINGPLVYHVARLAAAYIRSKRVVFIHCAAGVNRSGVVASQTMIELGYGAHESIGILRERRPGMLFNEYFVDWLTGDEDAPRWAPGGDLRRQHDRVQMSNRDLWLGNVLPVMTHDKRKFGVVTESYPLIVLSDGGSTEMLDLQKEAEGADPPDPEYERMVYGRYEDVDKLLDEWVVD
jgi:Dual specificity phosphatase, catalytic domain